MTRNRPQRLIFSAAVIALLPAVPRSVAAQIGPPPPGRLVDVDGHSMHIHCAGSGSPTVVIDAGAGTSSIAWLHIQSRLASFTRTCVFDRAGLGWSESRSEPRTGERAARELRALLDGAAEEPPFVIVGHSYGGYTARIFVDLFREDVAGLGLLESAHQDQWERLPPIIKQLLDASMSDLREKARAADDGRLRSDSVQVPDFFRHSALEAAYRAEQVDPDHYRTSLGEMEHMAVTITQLRNVAPLGTLPLVVLSSARGFDRYRGSPIPVEESNRVWLELQDELAALSEDAVHMVSQTAGHTLQYDEPEVVVGVIRELVLRARMRPSELEH
ncbi:MAG TPA: alpha/beta hydrolase [Longimicrobiales bacterium]|nr:alpha/beta hydrolase [Longimicrobiales bacterium]